MTLIKKHVSDLQKKYPMTENLAPSHLDLFDLNILPAKDRIWIVDWEYAGMADPLMDLASLAAAMQWTGQEPNKLLEAYNPNISDADREKYRWCQFLNGVRWGLWCYVQSKISPIDEWGKATLDFAFSKLD